MVGGHTCRSSGAAGGPRRGAGVGRSARRRWRDKQAVERIGAEARAVIRHRYEEGTQAEPLGCCLRGPRRRVGLDGGQRRSQVFGLQTAAGVRPQFTAEESLGLAVAHVVIAGPAATAGGRTEFMPVTGTLPSTAEVRGVHVCFADEHQKAMPRRQSALKRASLEHDPQRSSEPIPSTPPSCYVYYELTREHAHASR